MLIRPIENKTTAKTLWTGKREIGPGHQSVLVRLPKTGAVLMTIDAVAFRSRFVRDLTADESNPDREAIHASTIKLLDLVEQEHIGLVIFGHDKEQWEGLKKLPDYYE